MWDRYLTSHMKKEIDWEGLKMSGYEIFVHTIAQLSNSKITRPTSQKETTKIKQTIAYPICQYPCVPLSNFSVYTCIQDLHHRS